MKGIATEIAASAGDQLRVLGFAGRYLETFHGWATRMMQAALIAR